MTAPRRALPSRRAAVASPFTVNVRGVSFTDDYPGMLLEMARQVDEGGEVLSFVLMADTANPVDPLAVAVISADTGDRLGHLPADIGNRLSPLLTAGEEWEVADGRVTISPRDPLKPGLRVSVCRAGEVTRCGQPAPMGENEDLYVRIAGLGSVLIRELHRRWACSRLAAVNVIDLTPEQLRYARSLVGSLETEARRTGVDLEVGRAAARAHLVDLRERESVEV